MTEELKGDEHCGFVALVGRPNVGKSTLMNHLLGRKLSITSRKPQTTRHNLIGVDTQGPVQAVYVDTPGIHRGGASTLNRYMVRHAASVLKDVDVVVLLVDAGRWTEEDDLVVDFTRQCKVPVLCAINKIDLISDKSQLLPLMQTVSKKRSFEEIVPVSALRGKGLDDLRRVISNHLPEGPHFYPADQVTDRSEQFIASEIIREKIMRQLGDELPHRVTVVIEQFERVTREKGPITHLSATIYVERAGQKAILIGKQGARLKTIGSEARKDIEEMLDSRVMLNLWVKVKPGWTNNEASLKRFGYE